jgi:quinol-cytochrome oxidoreductase complex cytochrome b subunit
MWSFGSLAGIFLLVQLCSGVILAMHYTPHALLAFNSIEHIMRDVNYGWLLRYTHATGASFFFIMVYIHMARTMYYDTATYPRLQLWYSGVIIYLLMMATAFLGYILPYGQMSFWGAMVITNLFSAIPAVGPSFAEWLWGGFSVDNPTLNRFFSLHYLLPFLIAGLAIVHLNFLHLSGSSNPLEVDDSIDDITFYPYFYLKDLFMLLVVLTIFTYFIMYYPDYFGHSDNYIPANNLVTPSHLVPEWYFLSYYATLRSTPNKFGGLLSMFISILLYFVSPFIDIDDTEEADFDFEDGEDEEETDDFTDEIIINSVLSDLGSKPVESPFVEVTQLLSFLVTVDSIVQISHCFL